MTTRFKTSLAAGLVAHWRWRRAMAAAFAEATAARQVNGAGRTAAARRPGRPGGCADRAAWSDPSFRDLDLTDDQKAQLKKIREARAVGVQGGR